MDSYNFECSSTLESERVLSAKIEHLLDEHNVAMQFKKRFLLAFSEAFTNALLHGNKLDPGKRIKVRIEINKKGLTADIIDEGKGGLEKLRHKGQPSLLSEAGRGVDLIRHYCTTADFVETSTGGLKVTLVMEYSKEKTI